VTPKIVGNMKTAHPEPTDIDGFEDLREEDQAKIIKTWQEGHVDPEDVPESAKKEEVEGEEKPKKKAAPKKKKDEEAGADAEEKPKKSRAKAKVGFIIAPASPVVHLVV
jgi:hypothetical protein